MKRLILTIILAFSGSQIFAQSLTRELYIPQLQFGETFKSTVMLRNRFEQAGRVTILPITAEGTEMSQYVRTMDIPAFDEIQIRLAEFPGEAASLVIRATDGIAGEIAVQSIDGTQMEVIPAAKGGQRRLTFQSHVDRDSFLASHLRILNVTRTAGQIVVQLVDANGETFVSSSAALSSLQSSELSLDETFGTEMLANAEAVLVTSSVDAAAFVVSGGLGNRLLALTATPPEDEPTVPNPRTRAMTVNAMAVSAALPSVQPTRPAGKTIALGFNKAVSWDAQPHNGVDYSSPLNNTILSVGPNGSVYPYTETTASSFGSINPSGPGPAIWVQYTLATGSPIYVLYGHTADSWTDKTQLATKTVSFKFNCQYTIHWKNGNSVGAGAVIGKTAPYYNGGQPAQHLHMSVFQPNTSCNKTFCGPPSSGWGYSAIHLATGDYINPEDFFTLPAYKLKQ